MDKTAIAKKIIHFRKLKGITQEALSEMCGLNVRTIQRIEAGEVDPRLYTLRTIADALEVNIEELLPAPSQHERNQIAILHITPAAFFIFPLIGNVLVPFIFWMLKREEVNGINKHGKDILNSQLTWSLVAGLLVTFQIVVTVMAVFTPEKHFVHEFLWRMPVYMMIGLALAVVVFGIAPAINAVRVYQGKEPWRNPVRIRFFR